MKRKIKRKILTLGMCACFLLLSVGCSNNNAASDDGVGGGGEIEEVIPPQNFLPPAGGDSDNSNGSDGVTGGEEESDVAEGEEVQPEPEPIPQVRTYAKVTTNGLNLRSGASASSSVVGSLNKGEIYSVLEIKNGWIKTFYRGKERYFSEKYAEMFTLEKNENKTIENVIAEGEKLLGTPYVYGAVRLHDGNGNLNKNFTSSKFDCSSLMQYMFYYGASINLQVNTRTQVFQGKKVASGKIETGDLMFFTNTQRQYNTGVERIGHVGIYIGDGYMLHTASDIARVEYISSARWKFFIEARRMI